MSPLVNSDVLFNKTCNLNGLVCLNPENIFAATAINTVSNSPADSLLHQVATLHVEIEHTVFRLHLHEQNVALS